MPSQLKALVTSVGLACLALLMLFNASPNLAQSNALTVCPAGPPVCEFASIQTALDVASPGDIIKIAGGTYSQAGTRNDMTQIAYINKPITLRGGYSPLFSEPPDPIANLTRLDPDGQGRVVYITGAISVSLEGLRLTGGVAASGGGLSVVSATLHLSGTHIYSNTAYRGGGVYLEDGHLQLEASAILSNTAAFGGGLYLTGGQADIASSRIEANFGGQGGGGYLENVAARLNAAHIYSNTAHLTGGGLHLVASQVVFEDDVIAANRAESGGGLYLWHSSSPISRTRLVHNRAVQGGGGYLVGGDSRLVNSLVADNQASGHGSGLYVRGASPQLVHITLARNTTTDGFLGNGLYLDQDEGRYSHAALTNTLILDQSPGVSLTRGNTLTVNGILWYNTPITIASAASATLDLHNQFSGDPVLTPDGYHLSAWSQAINQGVDIDVRDDIDGQTRPGDRRYDLGADEFYPEAGLNLAKHAHLARVQAGRRLTYTLYLTNTGNITLTAAITDVLPAQLSSRQTLTWTPTITRPGASATHTLVTTAAWSYSGTLTNTLLASTPGGAVGVYYETSQAYIVPGLTATKQAWPNPVQAGERLTYTIYVTNTGSADLHTTITDTLPLTLTPGHTPGGTAILPGQPITWAPVITAPGGVWSQTLVITTAWGYAGWLTNTVKVTSLEGVSACVTHTTLVQVTPSLTTTKRAWLNAVQAGEQLTYTLYVTNTGNAALHVTVNDMFPVNISSGHTSGNKRFSPGETVTWREINLGRKEVWTETAVVTVTAGYAGLLNNVIQATSSEGASASFVQSTLSRAAKLAVSKRVEPNPVRNGHGLTYTLYVTNTGNIGLHAIITDVLPDHMLPGGILTWQPVITAPGGVWSRQITGVVEVNYIGPLVNVVRVTTSEDAAGIYTHTARSKATLYLPLTAYNWQPPPPELANFYLHRQDTYPLNFLNVISQDGSYIGFDFSDAQEWQTTLTYSWDVAVYGYSIYASSPYPSGGGGVSCDVEILLRRNGQDTLLASWPQAFSTPDSYHATLFTGLRVGVSPAIQTGDLLILRIRPRNGKVRLWMNIQAGNGGYSYVQIPPPPTALTTEADPARK